MRDRFVNLIWKSGIRSFRLARKANLSAPLEPAFTRLASLVPARKEPVAATLPNGMTFWMPQGYRDTRTVLIGLFQESETILFSRLAVPGMTFVDIGAYAGYFTLLASSLVGAAGRVYAFEPDGLAFDFLNRNIVLNSCPNVIPVNKAISDRVSKALLVRDPGGPESFLTTSTTEGGSSFVETLSLDSFFDGMNWPDVDLVKMNIEGSELPALRGMMELSRRNAALQLVMEFNPSAMKRAHVSRADLTDALRKLGFRKGQIVERDLDDVPGEQLVPHGDAVYNLLLTK